MPGTKVHDRTLILSLAYLGTAGHGWQRQKDAVAVQEYLEKAFEYVNGGRETATWGASRTDVGVHARRQIVAADVRSDILPAKWVKGLNTRLPEGIVVQSAGWGETGWRPRSRVGDKTYCYRFSFSPVQDPFSVATSWWLPGKFDRDRMDQLAAIWKGQHNFAAAHHKARSQSETTIRTLTRSEIVHRQDATEYWVSGPGFLTHQIRILAGTLVAFAKGELSLADIESAMRAEDRCGLGQTAPAHGLTLEDIDIRDVPLSDQWPENTSIRAISQ